MRSPFGPSTLWPNADQLKVFVRFLSEQTGIVSGEEHRVTLASRIVMFCRDSGLSLDEAISMTHRRDKRKNLDLVSALTNGETSFFRDQAVFHCIENRVLPVLSERRGLNRRLRFWSAAASTGQEAYSLSMLLSERRELDDFQVSIFATDISEQRLARAREAIYRRAEVSRGLSLKRLSEHTSPMGAGFRMNERLRKMVVPSRLNLLDPWSALPEMDLIMIRNVMMYWSVETRRKVLHRVAQQLAPDGFIVFGSSENWDSLADLLPPVFDEHAGVFGGP